ncbi:MauE/DoxX family redox-associated membrane protein [Streptosporangium carneum]|uniref:Methylamine utilization protein MauE n=1 Tax=Streptosporangium carneum TaxID=47481 RepID=A0A9W6MCQ9_9ACTN|nr:MauE/DoxX family redox-associated membrane protein [Streptosporangium carneum]GLK09431.1 methylamine utilization protein MauE [Streptosporangium carneum]
MPYVLIACGALLAAVFGVSAVGKLRGGAAFASFSGSLVRLRLLPRAWAGAAAALVVTAEGLVPPLLAFPATRMAGFCLAAGLMTAFCVGIELSVRRGASAPCRCFGVSSSPLGRRHLIRNSVLLAASLSGGAAVAAGASGPLHPAGVAVALASAGCAAVAVVRFDDIAELFTGSPGVAAR